MSSALGILVTLTKLLQLRKGNHDYDLAFVIFSKYTPAFLVVCVVIVTPKQFFGSPITCMPPKSMTSAQISWATAKCFVGAAKTIPRGMKVSDFDFESNQTNRWYAFTPLIIFFTIVPFVVISKIWSTLNSQGGIDVSKACEAAKIYQSITDSKSEADRQEVLRHIIRNLKIVDSSKQDRPMYEGNFNCCRCFSRFNQSYLANLWILVKVLYLVAVVLNVAFFTQILGRGYVFIGFNFIQKFTSSKSIVFDQMFPLVTWCKVDWQSNNAGNRKAFSCLMNMNIYNEKIFIAIWFWFLFIFIFGLLDLIFAVLFRRFSKLSLHFFSSFMPVPKNNSDHVQQRNFFAYGIPPDCLVGLRLMGNHLDHMTMTILVKGLWEHHLQEVSHTQFNKEFNIQNEISISDDNVDEIKDEMAIIANNNY